MEPSPGRTFTAFVASSRIAAGGLEAVAVAAKAAHDAGAARLLVLDDDTGRPVELDLRGSVEEVKARLRAPLPPPKPPGRGRPRLGVTAKEVTLLPSQWAWLQAQPGGASATLRRLVEDARRAGPDLAREAQEAAYRAMSVLAGDAPRYEEATRAFFARDYARFEALSAHWPADVGDYVRGLVRRAAGREAAVTTSPR